MEQLNQNQGHGIEPNVRETQQNTNKEHVTVLARPYGPSACRSFYQEWPCYNVWNRTAAKADPLITTRCSACSDCSGCRACQPAYYHHRVLNS